MKKETMSQSAGHDLPRLAKPTSSLRCIPTCLTLMNKELPWDCVCCWCYYIRQIGNPILAFQFMCLYVCPSFPLNPPSQISRTQFTRITALSVSFPIRCQPWSAGPPAQSTWMCPSEYRWEKGINHNHLLSTEFVISTDALCHLWPLCLEYQF